MIHRKRIRNLDLYLNGVPDGALIRCVVPISDCCIDKLVRIGFTSSLSKGESVLPAVVGPITRFNAEGHWLRLTDQKKEIAYRTVEWRWKERHGIALIERSDFRDISYQRYPRRFIEPPAVELSLFQDKAGAPIVCTPATVNSKANRTHILHAINLLLELFSRCELLNEDFTDARPVPIKRLNWQVLPQGRVPWDQLRTSLVPAIERTRSGNRAFLEHRFKTIHSYQPDFQAIGQAGFSGYVVFGFEQLNCFICESAHYGNATYIFSDRWQSLSQRSKAEILNGNLHLARIVHLRKWTEDIGLYLGSLSAEPFEPHAA